MKRKAGIAVWVTLVGLLFAVIGCGGGGGGSTPGTNNNSGSSGSYAISGKVADSAGTGVSGVTVALSGTGTGSTTTDSAGSYSFLSLANGSYTVTPSKSGYTCTPTSKAVTVSGANVTGQDFVGSAASGGATTAAYLFYKSSLVAVDPSNPGSTVTVDSQQINGAAKISAGTFSPGPPVTVSDLHTYAVIYGGQDGKLYKVSALKSGGTPTKVQVSSETGAATICNKSGNNDFANPDNSGYIYSLPGTDGLCNTTDDVWRMVKIGMTATTAPVPAKESVMSLNNWQTGAITGFLAKSGNSLNRYDANFDLAATVTTFTTLMGVYHYASNGDTVLWVDNKLFIYHIGTNTLSNLIYTSSSTYHNTPIDGTNGYFKDGTSIYKFPLDGSAAATVLATESGTIDKLFYTDSKVVYVSSQGSSSTLKAVSKTGGTASTLDSATSGGISIYQVSGTRIYYNITTGSGSTAKVANENGTIESSISNAVWTGAVGGTTVTLGPWTPVWVLRVDGMTGTGMANGTLKSIDASNNTAVVTLGTVPSDIKSIVFYGNGNDMLGTGSTNGTSSTFDIFFMNSDTPNSLVRVTNTPTISEGIWW